MNSKGFTIIGLIITLIIGAAIALFLLSRVTSDENSSQKATDIIDEAESTVEKANNASNRASNLINEANETLESISQ